MVVNLAPVKKREMLDKLILIPGQVGALILAEVELRPNALAQQIEGGGPTTRMSDDLAAERLRIRLKQEARRIKQILNRRGRRFSPLYKQLHPFPARLAP